MALITGERLDLKYPLNYSNYNKGGELIEESVNTPQSNEEVLYNFSPTGEGTYTQIVNDDFILTLLSAFLMSGSSSDKSHTIYIDSNIILKWEADALATGDRTTVEKEINIPNWLIKKGTVLKLVATESGAQGLDCNYSFIGFKIK